MPPFSCVELLNLQHVSPCLYVREVLSSRSIPLVCLHPGSFHPALFAWKCAEGPDGHVCGYRGWTPVLHADLLATRPPGAWMCADFWAANHLGLRVLFTGHAILIWKRVAGPTSWVKWFMDSLQIRANRDRPVSLMKHSDTDSVRTQL